MEEMLWSLGSKVAWVSRTASKVFGPTQSFRAAFLAIVAVALSYGTGLLAVVYAYRRGYGIVGRPELALRFTAKRLISLKQKLEGRVDRPV
jgi:hypothetical protein